MIFDQAPGSFSTILAETNQNWGQSFRPTVDGLVEKISIYLNNEPPFTFPVGTIRARIWDHSGEYGVSSVGIGGPGDELAVSDAVDPSVVIPAGFDGAYVDFTFLPRFRIYPNTPYVFTIDGLGDLDSAILIPINFDNPNSHAGNSIYYTGVGWSALASYDLADWTVEGEEIIMSRVDYTTTNVTTFDTVTDTLANDIFVNKIGVDGATAGSSVVITDKNDKLVFRWTCRTGEESKMFTINKKSSGIKFTSITGTVTLYGNVEGTPASI